jgi:hypothetical protein
MARIKNRLIVRIIYLFVIAAFFSPHAVLAESHIISEISDNMVIAVKDSNIHYELSDIYIEGNVATKAREKINTVASGKEFSFNNISQFPGRHGNFYATIQPASEISQKQKKQGWVFGKMVILRFGIAQK